MQNFETFSFHPSSFEREQNRSPIHLELDILAFTNKKNDTVQIENYIIEHTKEADQDIVRDAILFMKDAHQDQKRKLSGTAYKWHPLRAAALIAARENDTAKTVALLLHDTVEDCNIDLKYIEERYGEQIRVYVDALTIREGESDEDNCARIKNAKAEGLKEADMGDNTRDPLLAPAEIPRRPRTKAKMLGILERTERRIPFLFEPDSPSAIRLNTSIEMARVELAKLK